MVSQQLKATVSPLHIPTVANPTQSHSTPSTLSNGIPTTQSHSVPTTQSHNIPPAQSYPPLSMESIFTNGYINNNMSVFPPATTNLSTSDSQPMFTNPFLQAPPYLPALSLSASGTSFAYRASVQNTVPPLPIGIHHTQPMHSPQNRYHILQYPPCRPPSSTTLVLFHHQYPSPCQMLLCILVPMLMVIISSHHHQFS